MSPAQLFAKESPTLRRCFVENAEKVAAGEFAYFHGDDVAAMAAWLLKTTRGADDDIRASVVAACEVAKNLSGCTHDQDSACGLLLADVGRFLASIAKKKGRK